MLPECAPVMCCFLALLRCLRVGISSKKSSRWTFIDYGPLAARRRCETRAHVAAVNSVAAAAQAAFPQARKQAVRRAYLPPKADPTSLIQRSHLSRVTVALLSSQVQAELKKATVLQKRSEKRRERDLSEELITASAEGVALMGDLPSDVLLLVLRALDPVTLCRAVRAARSLMRSQSVLRVVACPFVRLAVRSEA